MKTGTIITPSSLLWRGNNLKVLPKIPDQSVDAIVTDPPYGTSEAGKSKLTKTAEGFVPFAHHWDQELPLEWLTQGVRLLRPGGACIVWTDTKRVGDLWQAMQAAGLKPLQTLYWHKTNPAPNPRKNYASAVEAAVFARKPGKIIAWNGGGFRHNVVQAPLVHWTKRIHPTQKPVSVMRWCLEPIAPAGGTVLDPFMGSGSTGEACAELGLQFIGVEMDRWHYQDACARLGKPVPYPIERAA